MPPFPPKRVYHEIDGIMIVDKPKTWTSHDVCAFIRKRFQIKKVGHAGTLDPIATGVLVILLGKATKQSMHLSSFDKQYEGVFQLGVKTDSHDMLGKVLAEAPWQGVSLETLRDKALAFTGPISQVPPMVSALKHKGVRLYKLARRGQDVPRESRKITVHAFQLLRQEDNLIYFSTHVSKGTYVRTLIHDLGESAGCFAALRELRRIQSGYFDISQSLSVDELRNMDIKDLRTRVFPLTKAPSHAHSYHD